MANYWEKKKKQKQKKEAELQNSKGQTTDEWRRGTSPSPSKDSEGLRNAYGHTYEEYKSLKENGGSSENKYDKWKSTSNALIREYDDYSFSGQYMTQEKHDEYYKRINEQLKQAASMREKYGDNVDEINEIVEMLSTQVQDNYEGRKYYSQWEDDETYQQFLQYQKESEEIQKTEDIGVEQADKKQKNITSSGYPRDLTRNSDDSRQIRYAARMQDSNWNEEVFAEQAVKRREKEQALKEKEKTELVQKAALIPTAEDFNEKSQYIDAGWKRFFSGDRTDYEYINDTPWSTKYQGDSNGYVAKEEKLGYDYLTDEERSIYNYFYNTEGNETAKKYLETLNLTERMAEDVISQNQEYAKEHPVLASAVSTIRNVGAGGMGFAEGTWNAITGKGIDENSYTNLINRSSNAIRETVAGGIDSKAGAFLYQTGMSMADSLTAMIATSWAGPLGLAPGTAAGFVLGSNAATNAMLSAKERGASDGQAVLTGLAQGAAEMFFEKYSIGELSALKDVPVKTLKDAFKNVLKQAGVEGTEELFTSMANSLTDLIINGDLSENRLNWQNYIEQGYSETDAHKMAGMDYLKGLFMDFLGGAISGGTMSGGAQAINYATRNQKSEEILEEHQEKSKTAETSFENQGNITGIDGELTEEGGAVTEGNIATETVDEIPWEEAQMYSGEMQQNFDENTEVAPAQPIEGVRTETKPAVTKAAQAAKENVDTILQYGQVDDKLAVEIVKNPEMKAALEEKTGVKITGNESQQKNGVKEAVRIYGEKHGSTVPQNISSSASGRHNATVNGRGVEIIGIQSESGSNPKFKAADGKSYTYEEITFADDASRKLYATAALLAIDSNEYVADTFIKSYNKSYPIEAYSRGFQLLYNAGRDGVPMLESIRAVEYMVKNTDFNVMAEAWFLGNRARNQENSKVAVETKQQKRKGKGTFEDQTRQFGPVAEIARLVADRTGIDIVRKSGLEHDANAAFIPSTMTMLLSENAQNEYTSLIHELGEFGLSYNREGMKQLQEAIVKYWAEKNGKEGLEDINALVRDYQRRYAKVEGTKTKAQAMDEIVNDALGGLFSTETGVNEFVQWLQEDSGYNQTEQRTIIQRIIDMLDQVVAYLKDVIKGSNLTRAAQKTVQMEEQRAKEIRKMFMDVLDAAIENANTAGAYETDAEVKHHISEKFSEEIDMVLNGKMNPSYQVKARDYTPKILVENGVKDLPMLITQRHVKSIIYSKNEAETLKLPRKDNYHGLGKDLLIKAIDGMDDPLDIYKLSDNEYLIVTEFKDQERNEIIVPVKLKSIGNYNGLYIEENQIKSVYGRNDLRKYLHENKFKRIYKKKRTTLNQSVQYAEISDSFKDSISDTSENASGEKKFSLAGVDALTADNDARIKAYYMEQEGKNELEIFRETGWFRGADGKWRFEIDDSDAKVYRKGDAELSKNEEYIEWEDLMEDYLYGLIDEDDHGKLERLEELNKKMTILRESKKKKQVRDYLEHPRLFEAYPFIANIPVNKGKMDGTTRGQYSMYDGISVERRFFEEYQELNLKKIILHEIQHVIQHFERFAYGANTDIWKNIKIKKNQKKFDDAIARKNEAFYGGNEEFKKLVRRLNQLQLEENFDEEYDRIENELYEKYEKRYMDYDNAMFEARMYADSEELSNFEKYEMTAGEIEARETASRSEWSEESRKEKLPNRTTDNGVIFVESRMNNPFVYEDESVSYSLNVDIDEEIAYFGVENKLNDYIGVQKAVLEKLDNENFYTDVVNEATGIKISIGRKGIKETLSSGKRFQTLPKKIKKLKIATLRILPELLQKSILTTDNAENIHNRSPLFSYFETDVEINGESYRITFDVKKTSAKNHFWIHCVRINEKDSALLTSAPTGQKIHETQNPSERRVADKIDDVKHFSLPEEYDELRRENESLLRENETFKQVIDSLESRLNLQKGVSVSEENIEKVANKLYRKYKSNADKEDFVERVTALFQSGETSKGDFLFLAEQIMRPVLENSKNNQEISDYAKGVLKDIRKTTIKLDGMQKNEVTYHYGTYNDFRKSLFGRTNLSDKGTPLDILWKQWSESYPEIFDADISSVDQPMRLATIIGDLKENYVSDYGFMMDDAVSYAAMELMNEYAALPEVKKLSDNASDADFRAKYWRLTNSIKKDYQEQLKSYKAKQKETRAERVERQERKKYKESIIKSTKAITRWFEQNTDKYHVPEVLRDTTLKFLESMDFLSEKGWNSQDTIQLQNRLNILYRKFSKEESDSEGSSFMQDIDPDFLPTLDGLISLLENSGEVKKIADMDSVQLKEVAYLVGTLKRTISTANKLIGNKRYEQVSQLGDSSVSHMAELKAKKHLGKWRGMGDEMLKSHMLDSFSFFERMGEGAKSIHQEIREGFNKRVWLLEEAKRHMQEVIGETKIKNWTGKKADLHEFNYNGQEFGLTTGQLMNLYVLSKRPQAFEHLMAGKGQSETGGFTVDAKSVVKGQKITERRVKVSETQMREMFEKLTPEQKKMADAMQKFLAKNCSEWGNEVSMTLYGYKKFGEKTYWPIKTNENFNKTDDRNANNAGGDNTSLYAIRNQGMTKNLVKNANNPIVVGDIFDVFSEHVANMANYNAFVVPLTDAMKWFNYRSRTEDGAVSGSIKEEMERAFGKGSKSYFINFIKDVNGEVNKGTASEISNTFTSKYKAAAVGANIRTVVQQPTSYFRAASVMNPKYLVAGLAHLPAIKEMHENSAIAVWKSWGYFETGLGQSMKQVLTGEGTITEKIVETGMAGAGKADDITWGTIWNAVKAEVKDKNKDIDISSGEYMRLVSKRFDEVIDQTQVVDTVLHRSQIMRSQNGIVKMATAFMSEPTKSYNLLYNALRKTKEHNTSKNRTDVARKAVVYGFTGIMTAVAASFVDAFRDDDEEKEYWDKWMENFWANAKDNLNPFNMVPYLKEIPSLWEGYDSSRMDMAGISSLISSVQQAIKFAEGDSQKNLYGVVKGILRGISQTTGIPMYNALRDVESLIEQFMFAPIDEKELTAKTVRIRLLKASKEGNDKQLKKYLAWYDEQYQEKIAEGKSDKEARSDLKSSITSQYKEIYQNSTNAEKIKIKQLLLKISVGGKQLYKDYDWSSWDKKKED